MIDIQNFKKNLPNYINLPIDPEKKKNNKKKIIQIIEKPTGQTKKVIVPKVDNEKICSVIVANFFSLDYGSPRFLQYSRYGPNGFRYVDPNSPTFPDYTNSFNSDDIFGDCLRRQLLGGYIRYYPLDFLFILLVPYTSIDQITAKSVDDYRNSWISFCLNIEKSFLYFNEKKLTCNNQIFQYETYVNYVNFINQEFQVVSYVTTAIGAPLSQIDQSAIYSIATSSISSVTSTNLKKPIDPATILAIFDDVNLVTDLPIPTYFEIVFFTYSLLTFLFSTSNKLLQGKETGLPKEFIDLFFPLNRQLYYYNLYYTWIQSRQRYLGFGDKINSSNGDGTYLAVPNFNAYPFKQFS